MGDKNEEEINGSKKLQKDKEKSLKTYYILTY